MKIPIQFKMILRLMGSLRLTHPTQIVTI